MAKITTRIEQGRDRRKDHSDAGHSAEPTAATAGSARLMNLNLSTYIRVRFGGFAKTPSTSTPPTSTGSPAAVTGIERDTLIRRRSGSLPGHPG